jgi:hypothetical protein
MPPRRSAHAQATRLLSAAMIVIGIAIVVRTLIAGGGAVSIGIIFGVLFVAAGSARLYLQGRGT